MPFSSYSVELGASPDLDALHIPLVWRPCPSPRSGVCPLFDGANTSPLYAGHGAFLVYPDGVVSAYPIDTDRLMECQEQGPLGFLDDPHTTVRIPLDFGGFAAPAHRALLRVFAAAPGAASVEMAQLVVRHAEAIAALVDDGRLRAEEALSRWCGAARRPALPWLSPSTLRPHLPGLAAELDARDLHQELPSTLSSRSGLRL